MAYMAQHCLMNADPPLKPTPPFVKAGNGQRSMPLISKNNAGIDNGLKRTDYIEARMNNRIMTNTLRANQRIPCNEKCIIVFNGSKLECILESISISGALISVNRNESGFVSGCRCSLYLCADTQKCPFGFACQVTYVNATEVGLEFVNQL